MSMYVIQYLHFWTIDFEFDMIILLVLSNIFKQEDGIEYYLLLFLFLEFALYSLCCLCTRITY